MITKRIPPRKDRRSSPRDALRYGEGLKIDPATGECLDKSHRTRFGNFGLVDDGVYVGRSPAEMAALIDLAAGEMQSTCDLNTRAHDDTKMAHLLVSFDQVRPSEAVLRDTEDSMLAALGLESHFASFLHDDNGHWHLHIFASRIERSKPHRCNSLWRDQTKRDRVCREIEMRHGLPRDNGLHRIDEHGRIVEVPRAEREAARRGKPSISDRAKTVTIYSGEKTFQEWCNEIRIGDRLKHARSWQDLHAAAAAYGCEVRPKGAGFVICPLAQKGGIQLSKVGLKNLPARFGAFQAIAAGTTAQTVDRYEPTPLVHDRAGLYTDFKRARDEFKPSFVSALNAMRDEHITERITLRAAFKAELTRVRGSKRADAFEAVAVLKMQQATELTALATRQAAERKELRLQVQANGPGATFRDYLLKQANAGNVAALSLLQTYGERDATKVSRDSEAEALNVVASMRGIGIKSRTAMPATFVKH